MQASNAPTKSAVPFADSGTKNTIPVASQIGVKPGLASFTDGFPPVTMTPLAAGGIPPSGADFNGILNFLSTAVRWSQAGGQYPFDAAFASAVGGYPKGAILPAGSGDGFWINLIDGNSANPDAGGLNWSPLQRQHSQNDATAGRMLTVGSAFGIGAPNYLDQVDLDTVRTSGLYSQWNRSWATIDKHYPVADISGIGSLVVVASGNGDLITQQYTTFDNAQTYTRSCGYGTWKPWRRAVTLDDFTGANQQLQPNGFQRVPGGLLLQCGSVTVAANNAPTVINLPIPWPVGGMIPICSPGGLVASAVSCGCAITGISQLTLWQSGTNPITVVYHVWGR